MKKMNIKQNSVDFHFENRLSIRKPVSQKIPHYPVLDLVLNELLCIFDAKKGCKKKSLNKFSSAADLLKFSLGSHFVFMCVVQFRPCCQV